MYTYLYFFANQFPNDSELSCTITSDTSSEGGGNGLSTRHMRQLTVCHAIYVKGSSTTSSKVWRFHHYPI